MLRVLYISLLAVALPTVQAGCCCCRLPAQMVRLGAVNAVRNAQAPEPPVVVEQPPVQPPPVQPPANPPFNPPPFNPPKDQFKPPVQADAKVYVYSQRTGELKLGNDVIGKGFSGTGAGRNNPAMQNRAKVGPIPVGDYGIIGKGPVGNGKAPNDMMIRLLPIAGASNTFGRFGPEPFTITPDTGSNAASEVVMPRDVIDRIEVRNGLPWNLLRVVP
jgi:hypothetical protein